MVVQSRGTLVPLPRMNLSIMQAIILKFSEDLKAALATLFDGALFISTGKKGSHQQQ